MKLYTLTRGSLSMGMGHIFRQRTLTRKLPADMDVTFLIPPDANTERLLCESGIRYRLYTDEREIPAILAAERPDVLIVDRLDTTEEEMCAYRAWVPHIVTFDDRGAGGRLADFVINAIVPPRHADENVRFGEQYMVFSDAVTALAEAGKTIRAEQREILVTFGGSDPRDFTGEMAAIARQNPALHFRVVIGPNYAHPEQTVRKLEVCENVEVLCGIDDLSALLYEADTVILSGGITLYEAVFIGTPCIVLCQVAHQTVTAARFMQHGACRDLGLNPTAADVQDALAALSAQAARQTMHDRQRAYIPHSGTDRILRLIQTMKGEKQNENQRI